MAITTAIQQDIHSLVHATPMNGVFFTGDDNANRIEVTVTDNGRPVALSGTVYAYVTGADGETRKITGTISDGNKACVTIQQAEYIKGPITVIIKLENTGSAVTIAALTGFVS